MRAERQNFPLIAQLHLWDSCSPLRSRSDDLPLRSVHLTFRPVPLRSRAGIKGNGSHGPRPPHSPPITDDLPLNRWLFLFVAWILISRNDNNILITLLKLSNAFSYSYCFYNLPPIDHIGRLPEPQAPPAINLTILRSGIPDTIHIKPVPRGKLSNFRIINKS